MLDLSNIPYHDTEVFVLEGERHWALFLFGLLAEQHQLEAWPVHEYEARIYHDEVEIVVWQEEAQLLIDFLSKLCNNEGVEVLNQSDYDPTPEPRQMTLEEVLPSPQESRRGVFDWLKHLLLVEV